MNRELLDKIVQATLYEGYVLYPYRASSQKNQRERFTFGRVYPEAYSVAQNGAEPCSMQTECLVRAFAPETMLHISVRFLQPMAREVGVPWHADSDLNLTQPEYKVVPGLRVGGEWFQTWHEAVEREVIVPPILIRGRYETIVPFHFCAMREIEPLREGGSIAVVIVRRQERIDGSTAIAVTPLDGNLFKISARVFNRSAFSSAERNGGEAVVMYLFASTHIILQAVSAEFISQMDPPAELKQAAASCVNLGVWPILVGDGSKGEHDVMLSSPIILYDYPKLAPESPGPLFDGTEIDEILTLRIQTMTDEEKREMRGLDEHARRLLERTEALPQSALSGMHGTIRNRQPSPEPTRAKIEFDDFFGAGTKLEGVWIGEVFLRPGHRVRLRPRLRADVMDIAIAGRVAVVEAVEQDLEHKIHLAVVLEDDPGKDLGFLRQPGHRFFYGIDEVELLREEMA